MEVAQAQSHIVKDGVADLLWENAILLNAGDERLVGRNSMTRMGARTPYLLEIDSQKLDNVGVAYLTE